MTLMFYCGFLKIIISTLDDLVDTHFVISTNNIVKEPVFIHPFCKHFDIELNRRTTYLKKYTIECLFKGKGAIFSCYKKVNHSSFVLLNLSDKDINLYIWTSGYDLNNKIAKKNCDV